VYGSLGRENVRRALDLNSWEGASDLIRGWEASGQIGVVKAEVPTVKEAVSKFLHDLEHGQQRKAATLSKHKNLLEKRLLAWCEKKGYRLQSSSTWTPSANFGPDGQTGRSLLRRTSNASARSSGSATARAGSK
jgi:hypothetical protein